MSRYFLFLILGLFFWAGSEAVAAKRIHRKCLVHKYLNMENSKTTRLVYGEKGNFQGSAQVASAPRPLSTF